MTYCLGMLLKDGAVLLSDSRTNAGMDHIATFRKMTLWDVPGDRTIMLTRAGNLGVSQAVLHYLDAGLVIPGHEEPRTMRSVGSMFEAAQLVGEAVRHVYRIDGERLDGKDGGGFNISFLLAGQVKGGKLRLFQIYSAGNFIEATHETPYFQIGETKYGKPILDRALSFDTDLRQAAKLGLISMDSTLRSNLSVGLPLDLAIYRRDSLKLDLHKLVGEEDPYFMDIRQRWSTALRTAFLDMPDPNW